MFDIADIIDTELSLISADINSKYTVGFKTDFKGDFIKNRYGEYIPIYRDDVDSLKVAEEIKNRVLEVLRKYNLPDDVIFQATAVIDGTINKLGGKLKKTHSKNSKRNKK